MTAAGPSRHFACANNQVAFRTKRTLDGMQDRRARWRMTRTGLPANPCGVSPRSYATTARRFFPQAGSDLRYFRGRKPIAAATTSGRLQNRRLQCDFLIQ
jgi:hypothetical protein